MCWDSDKQRINVAISRSLYGLVVIGDDNTLSSDDDWKAVRDACEVCQHATAQDLQNLKRS